ncbi:MAG: restriction endonuclease subunit S [Sandaracinaceae bacterium]|nr:restriction endonuclease subunit S [Sandaracinaceae bacterium]
MNVVDEVTAPRAHSTLVASALAGVRPGVTSSAVLLAQFHVLSETAGGTSALRKLILHFAIRWRLSTREAYDDSVTLLLAAAQRDRQSKLARGDARQMEELRVLGNDEVPFSLPHPWAWTRIGHAMNLVNGRAFKPNDWSTSGLPIVRIQNLNNPSAPFNHCAFAVEAKHHLGPGDFLISWSGTPGTSFGAFIWNGPKGVLNQHIFRGEIYAKAYELGFLRIAINARLDEMIAQAHGGVGLQHITKGKLEALAIPLPPLAEQKRIVAKVDQLMALCDELEARQTKKRVTSARLTKSALEALTTAEGPEEFDVAWKRVVENFDLLVNCAEKVSAVRQSVLDLATSGRLNAGATGNGLPADWTWETVESVTSLVTDGEHLTPQRVPVGIPLVTAKNVRDGHMDYTTTDFVEIQTAEKCWRRCKPQVGDLLMVCVGATTGRMCVLRDAGGFVLVRSVAVLRPDPRKMTADFLSAVLRSPRGQRQIWAGVKQQAQPCLYLNRMKVIRVPCPPLQEQGRIVAKVEQLMKLCDALEARLGHAEDCATKLVEAVVQELVA